MVASTEICPICGEGHLEHKVAKNNVEYKGQSAELDLLYSECDSCGSEQSDAAQLRANKRAMVCFKKQVDGLLTGVQVRALRERLGINQAEAARIFGGGPVAFSKYEADDVAQSEAMDKLLRLADSVPVAFEQLVLKSGVKLDSKATGGWVKVEMPRARKGLRVISSSQPEPEGIWKAA